MKSLTNRLNSGIMLCVKSSIYFDSLSRGNARGGRCLRHLCRDISPRRPGRFLRKTRLDELPQLWNILKGELSIVGPRPERECFYKEFETYIHGFSNRLKVKPGLIGLAQVNGGYDLKPEEKIVFDMEYIRERSVWIDLGIILKTVGVVVFGRGAK